MQADSQNSEAASLQPVRDHGDDASLLLNVVAVTSEKAPDS